jgi:uncharacterized SAM-binding protein YcdF (DUF218 family)
MFGIAAIVILWIASTAVIANWLTAGLESPYRPVPVKDMPHADAVIILGGVLRQPLPPRIEPDLSEPVDRIIEAWRPFREKKEPTIVVSGGDLPWAITTEPEAILIRRFLVELSVPESAFAVEPKSQITGENAINTTGIFRSLGWNSALLVTSGTQMRRAVGAFQRAGSDVVQVSTDIQGTYPLFSSFLDFLPNAAALAITTTAIKE